MSTKVSKLFRAYGLYNKLGCIFFHYIHIKLFQSSFELTGYITCLVASDKLLTIGVSKLFRAYGLYNI